jgi:hypothetical protein
MHPGVTGPAIPYGNSHYHEAEGMTTYVDGHYHVYNTVTSLAVPVQDGYHTHHVDFETSFDDGHRHSVMGYIQTVKEDQ